MNKKYRFLIAPVLFLTSFFAVIQINAAGEVDSNFNALAYRGLESSVTDIVRQPDGKILIGGTFRVANGVEKCSIVRLNADRSIDNTFQPPQFYLGPFVCNGVQSLAVQPDGKILVAGKFYGTLGNEFAGIRRLNADGSIDPTFDAYANITVNSSSAVDVDFVDVQTDGKILLSGNYNLANQNGSLATRLNSNGTIESNYNSTQSIVRILKLQPDGKILVQTTGSGIKRLNPDGTTDSTFQTVNANQRVRTVAIDSAGRIYLAGEFSSINGFLTGNVVRLNADGSLDASFSLNYSVNATIYDLAIDADGKILVTGNFFDSSTGYYSITRLNSDGTEDSSFTSPFNFNTPVAALSVLPLPDGKILLGASATNAKSLYLLNSDGSFDNSFNVIVGSTGIVNRILQQPDGKILVGGTFRYANGNKIVKGVARFNQDGTVDNTFSQTVELDVIDLAVQSDGKILVASPTGLKRLNADGTIDTNFPTLDAFILRLKILPNGKFLVAGSISYATLIQRRNADGTLDNTFASVTSTDSNGRIYDFEVQPDGKIVVGGTFTKINGVVRGNFARLNADGTVDTSFNPPFGANAGVTEVALQSTGKIILGGVFNGLNGTLDYKAIGRVNSDGSLDTSFAPPPIYIPPSTAPLNYVRLKVQPDDKILVTDRTFTTNYTSAAKLIRLLPNGALDNSLTATTNSNIADINLQNDGKILLGGDFTRVNNVFRTDIARLLNPAVPQNRTKFDYDGDGRSDVSVFRSSNGAWYIQQSTSGFTGVNFGQNGDLIVPADYDGDGKTDIAVFRPSNGAWYRLNSSDGSFFGITFGQNGDIPIPGDFDGDGKADISVFRPSNGAWYRMNSSDNSFYGIIFGQNGDKPLLADFDGDGKNDIAVFRPSSNGAFYSLDSSNGAFRATTFGYGTDVPVPADYDGDGKTDVAVFRPSNGAWYRYNSSNGGFVAEIFGQNGDVPVPADYDGDGKANLAVFRPSANSWYIARPTGTPAQNFDAVLFGAGTDKPTPAAFQ